MKSYDRILRAVRSTPWAIQPEKLEEIVAFLELRAAGGHANDQILTDLRAQRAEAAARAGSMPSGAVCVVPVYGSIMHRSNMLSEYSGGTSCTALTMQFRQALSDLSVKAIVFDVDSPGGTIDGVPELADEIFKARGKKPMTAIADTLMASAAYWIASAADEVVMSPSALAGSIGVYCTHEDDSAMLDKMGVKMTMISYGTNKTEGNPYEPLTDAARKNMQAMVNGFGSMFVSSVAKCRGVGTGKVMNDFGQGRVFGANEAVSRGLADRVATLDQVLGKYGVSRAISGSRANGQRSLGAQAQTAEEHHSRENRRNLRILEAMEIHDITYEDAAALFGGPV